MASNRKYSYWIVGILVLILIVSVVPWEDAFTSGPKVGIVEINKPITVSKNIVADLNYFNEKSNIIAIVVRLDTPGGGVAASQEIYEKVKKIADTSTKPIIASMGGVAASGGYYIALGADTIMANPGTATGSIGVIMSYPIIGELMDKIGVQYETIKSGKLKDVLLQEYIHNQVYRTLKSFIPFTIAWNKRKYHRMFINKMWEEYKEIKNA